MAENKIKIIAAALKTSDGSILSDEPPTRHAELIRKAIVMGKELLPGKQGQGFLLSNGKYVSRQKAKKIAIQAGQVKTDNVHGVFTTEELW